MSTLKSSKSHLSHKELWGLVRDDDSATLLGHDAGDAPTPRGVSQDDQPIWLQAEDPDQTALQAKADLSWPSEWAPAWSMDLDASSGPSHFRHATATTPAGEKADRHEHGKAVGVSSDTTIPVSGEASDTPLNLHDGLQLISAEGLGSGPAVAGVAHHMDNAGVRESASLAQSSVDGSGTAATAAIMATLANQAPTGVTLTTDHTFKEAIGGEIVGTLSATDPDPGDTFTFSVNDPRFEVVGSLLKLKDGAHIDYEREPQVQLNVTATDSGGLSVSRSFTVSVEDVPEVRFAAFGDYGSNSGTKLVSALVPTLHPDFIITTGDNAYGTDPLDVQIGQFYSNYIGNYTGAYGPGSPTNRFFPSLGNHEYEDPAGGTNASNYLAYFTLPGNERYYDYTVGPIHFFVVNSNKQEPDGRTSTSAQAQWLQAGLANSTSQYNIVYFHHPPFSSGNSIGSSVTMQWPFEQWGATAVLNGHVHNYERIMRDDNADGTLMPYFVTGLGGTSKASFAPTPVDGSTVRYNANFGTMLIQASIYSITFDFYSVTGGGTLIDSYTIDVSNPSAALFTTGNDVVNFNQVLAAGYVAGSQYDALGGDDTVTLATDTKTAGTAGYDPSQTFHGGDGNDRVIGGGLNDTIAGDAGNDTLSGGGGDDKLDGGAGADTVDYGAAGSGVTVDLGLGTGTGNGSDTLLGIENVIGSDFDDTLTGSTGANILTGGGGNDILHGGDGNDTLTGGNGTDQLFGDAGHDTLKWDAVDSFDGGSGFDSLDASLATAVTIDLRSPRFAGLERILTGDGADTVTVRLGDVLADTADHQFVADLGNGADTLAIDLSGGWAATTADPTLGPTGTAAGISIAGMTAYTFTNGTDTVTIFSNAETVNQLSAATPLFTVNNDVVDFNQITTGSYLAGSQYDALAGDDSVNLPTNAAAASAAGYDPTQTIHGGDGADTITGGDLNDIIVGDAFGDLLSGGAGNDTINGGGSGDTLSGGLGDDLLDGGTGTAIDKVDYSAAAGAVIVDLVAGTATGEGNDTILNIENVSGSAFDDSITGNTANNTLLGGAGNDVLRGGGGNDSLTGEAGLDQLFGDSGNDTLKWDGSDSFDGGSDFDTLDANLATADIIDLRGAGYVGLERIVAGSGTDTITLSLDQVLADTADDQFVADLGLGTDTLKIDITGGWAATTPNTTLGPTGVAAGISIAGMTAYTFTKDGSTVTVFTNAEAVQQLIQTPPQSLFSSVNDTVDFNQVAAGSYAAGSQYDALAGNDTVTLPADAAAAAAAGYGIGQAFSGGDGNDTITGGGLNDLVNGGAGNDALTGAAGDDSLSGGNDDDILVGGAGNDTLDGGAGNDTANYSNAAAVVVNLALGTTTGDGTDTLVAIENAIGSGFDDTITGNAGANVLTGGGGNDVLAGGDGNDTLTGGAGLDKLDGGAGHDILKWDGVDTFDGGIGFDTLDADLASADSFDLRGAAFSNLERILTGTGNDSVTVSLANILAQAADRQFVADLGGGTDTLTVDVTGGWTVTAPNATLGPTGVDAGVSVAGMTAYTFTNGTSTVTVFSNAESVLQIPAQAALFTTSSNTVNFNQVFAGGYLAGTQYDALAGNDTVTLAIDAAAAAAAGFDPAQTFKGGDGNDSITGGTLNDLVSGGNGNDVILGGAGNDTIAGDSNNDKLDGGAGDDKLNGGGSGDTLIGGLGDDTLDGGSGTSIDRVDYSAAAGPVTVDLGAGTATGEGKDTLLNLEDVIGSAFDDAITGNGTTNALTGGAGNDVIHGGAGNDNLTGGTGIDQLFGDAGHDTLKWDSADSFDGGAGFDTLDANLSSADNIDLRGAGFANLERIRTGSGKDTVTLSLNDVLSDTADHQFVADLGSSSPDTLNIDTAGGWTATASNAALGPTGVAAGISVSGMTALTFAHGTDTVTVFTNAEVVHAQVLS